MTRLFRFCLSFACILGISPLAFASAVDTIRFSQDAVVIVWDDTGAAKAGAQVNIGSGLAPVPDDTVITGTLLPISNSMSGSKTTRNIVLASNAPVSLDVVSDRPLNDLQVRLVAVGANAAGPSAELTRIAHVPANKPVAIYRIAQKTAVKRGTPLSQSVALEVTWRGAPNARVSLTAKAGPHQR